MPYCVLILYLVSRSHIQNQVEEDLTDEVSLPLFESLSILVESHVKSIQLIAYWIHHNPPSRRVRFLQRVHVQMNVGTPPLIHCSSSNIHNHPSYEQRSELSQEALKRIRCSVLIMHVRYSFPLLFRVPYEAFPFFAGR